MPPDPSLFNLVANNYPDALFTSGIDVLNILSGQIEQMILANDVAPHLYIGIQNLSSFELYSAHYSELAKKCKKLTVFGIADRTPRQVSNTEFIALPENTTLTKERFVVVNHPNWQVLLLAQEDAESADKWERQKTFNGVITFKSEVVERCATITAMLSGNRPEPVQQLNSLAVQQNISQFVTLTALLPNLPHFDLGQALMEVPTLLNMATQVTKQPTANGRLEWVASAAHTMLKTDHVIIYRNEDNYLRPIVTTQPIDQVAQVMSGQGAIGQAAQFHRTINVTGAQAAQAVSDNNVQAVYAQPIYGINQNDLWGIVAFVSPNPQAFADNGRIVRLAALTGMIQGVAHREASRINSNGNGNLPEPPVTNGNGSGSENGNGAITTFSTPPTPNEPVAQPVAPSAPPAPTVQSTRKASRGRIRLGPRKEAPSPAAPQAGEQSVEFVRLQQVEATAIADDPYADYQRRMISQLLRFDRDGADRVWREAYSTFPARELITNILQPVLIAVGEGWHRGQVSVAAEHFTTSYVEGKIIGFLNSYPDNPSGMTIITGCAQGETHEVGIMMLSLFLRWDGHKVIYLGANVPNSTVKEVLQDVQPDMLCLSATMKENANSLTEVGHIIQQLPDPRPILAYGGAAFIFFPEMRQRVNGVYLGDDPDSIVKHAREVLQQRKERWEL